jgi:hypothetical protein
MTSGAGDTGRPKTGKRKRSEPGLGKTVLRDLKRGDLTHSWRQDLRDIYGFYLDEESRERLDRMRKVRKWFLVGFWVLKSMILSLSPGRRLLLLLSIILTWLSGTYTIGRYTVDMGFGKWGFLVILLVLMLELKDKLLAREELETGRAIQLALLPKDNPVLSGWEIWLYSRTANEVGGDLVDYIRLSDDRLGLALGDVSGKGLGAALLMSKLQATLRALVTDLTSLKEIGVRTNEIFCRDGISGRFATLLYLEIRPDSGHVRMLNAGHMPPMVLRAGGIEEIPPSGLPVGTLPEATYEEQTIDLKPGDLLINYTDGLTEACDSRGRFFGEVGLSDLIPTLDGLSAEETGSRITGAVADFIGDERPSDDLALIVLRRTG